MTNNDAPHVALPKLYGAPAYARPPAVVAHTTRPLDPDDLPIEAEQTAAERELARDLVARTYAGSDPAERHVAQGGDGTLRARPFRLRSIAGRILRGADR